MANTLLILLWVAGLCMPAVHAALWGRVRDASRSSPSRVEQSSRGSLDVDVGSLDIVSPAERNSIFRSLSHFDSFESKSDCFKDAAGQLKARCGGEMSEGDRVQAAVRFTLCELSTARQHSYPMECALFALPELEMEGDAPATSSCVEALSRSTQHWSSYSGYLREIPQLCFAYSRWHDIDRAKSFYQNATLEKISLLKVMQEREAKGADYELKRQAVWEENFLALAAALDQLNAVGTDLAMANEASASSIDMASIRLRESVDQMSELIHATVLHLEKRVQESVQDTLYSAAQGMVVNTQASMHSAVEKFSLDLSSSSLHTVEMEVGTVIAAVLDGIMVRSQETVRALDALDVSTQHVATGLSSIQDMTAALAASTEEVVTRVSHATDVLDDQSRALQSSTQNTQVLSSRLDLLAEQTESHLSSLNLTAHSVQSSLTAARAKLTDSSPLGWVFLCIHRLHPVFWQYLMSEPAFRAFWVLLQLVGQLGWFLLSTGAGWILLFRRRPAPVDPTSLPESPRSTSSTLPPDYSYTPPSQFLPPFPSDGLGLYQSPMYSPIKGSTEASRPRAGRVPRISPRLTSATLL